MIQKRILTADGDFCPTLYKPSTSNINNHEVYLVIAPTEGRMPHLNYLTADEAAQVASPLVLDPRQVGRYLTLMTELGRALLPLLPRCITYHDSLGFPYTRYFHPLCSCQLRTLSLTISSLYEKKKKKKKIVIS